MYLPFVQLFRAYFFNILKGNDHPSIFCLQHSSVTKAMLYDIVKIIFCNKRQNLSLMEPNTEEMTSGKKPHSSYWQSFIAMKTTKTTREKHLGIFLYQTEPCSKKTSFMNFANNDNSYKRFNLIVNGEICLPINLKGKVFHLLLSNLFSFRSSVLEFQLIILIGSGIFKLSSCILTSHFITIILHALIFMLSPPCKKNFFGVDGYEKQ